MTDRKIPITLPFMSIEKEFLTEVSAYLTATGMDRTTFGKMAMKDPGFVFDLEGGRNVGIKTIDRVRGFIEANPPKVMEQTA